MNGKKATDHTMQITRRLTIALAASMVLATAWTADGNAQTVSSSPRVLRFSDHEPLGGMRSRFLKDVLFPAIEAESEGRLKIEDHWDGEIAKAYDALAAVREGQVTDMATVVPEYTSKELPLHQIFKGFPTGPSGIRQIEFFQRVYAEVPAFSDELEKNGLVHLFFGTGYPVAFYSSEPMKNLGGLKGGKWRSASFWHLDFLRNSGATPVTMHWGPEIYDALKQRTLDGLMVNVDSGYMLKVHETAPNILVSKELWLGHLYILAMNKSVWDALAREDREAIRRAGEKSYTALGPVMDASFDNQLKDLRAAGATVRSLTHEEVARWQDGIGVPGIQSQWAEDRRADGINAKAALDAVSSIMADFVK